MGVPFGFISEGGSFAVGEDRVFLIFVVGALGMYYLMIQYLHFHLLSTCHNFLCCHLQEFESDLGILLSRLLFRMSFRFFSIQYSHKFPM